MGRDQQPGDCAGGCRGEGEDLGGQHQGETGRSVSAQTAVAHDLERTLPGPAAAEPVAGVGEAVLVEGAGGEQRRGGGEHEREADREHEVRDPEHRACKGADRGADERVVAGGRSGTRRTRLNRGAYRPAGEKLHREQQQPPLFAHSRHAPASPVRPSPRRAGLRFEAIRSTEDSRAHCLGDRRRLPHP